jgi:hypothetical protein
MREEYGRIKIGMDCLSPDVKRAKVENKARIIITCQPESDEEILKNAQYKGIPDNGPLSD